MNVVLRGQVAIGSAVAVCLLLWGFGFYERDQLGPLTEEFGELEVATFKMWDGGASPAKIYTVKDAARLSELRSKLTQCTPAPAAKWEALGRIVLRDTHGEESQLGLYSNSSRTIVGWRDRYYFAGFDVRNWAYRAATKRPR